MPWADPGRAQRGSLKCCCGPAPSGGTPARRLRQDMVRLHRLVVVFRAELLIALCRLAAPPRGFSPHGLHGRRRGAEWWRGRDPRHRWPHRHRPLGSRFPCRLDCAPDAPGPAFCSSWALSGRPFPLPRGAGGSAASRPLHAPPRARPGPDLASCSSPRHPSTLPFPGAHRFRAR